MKTIIFCCLIVILAIGCKGPYYQAHSIPAYLDNAEKERLKNLVFQIASKSGEDYIDYYSFTLDSKETNETVVFRARKKEHKRVGALLQTISTKGAAN